MKYNFYQSIEDQKPYKELFIQWFSNRPKVSNIREGTLEEDKMGIDFFITTTDNESYTVQLKVDFKADNTGNLPVETISQAYSWRNSVIGAEFNMSTVDYIFFFLIPSKRIIAFNFKDFIEYAIQNYKTFRNFGADNEVDNVKYRTLGCLIPISKIIHLAILDTMVE